MALAGKPGDVHRLPQLKQRECLSPHRPTVVRESRVVPQIGGEQDGFDVYRAATGIRPSNHVSRRDSRHASEEGDVLQVELTRTTEVSFRANARRKEHGIERDGTTRCART